MAFLHTRDLSLESPATRSAGHVSQPQVVGRSAKSSGKSGSNFWQTVRSAVGASFRIADRLFHGSRRRAARQRIAHRAPFASALFICHGNICRSPFAAAVFARAANEIGGLNLIVTSAGFIGPGRRPPEDALVVSARRDIDLTGHRSAIITGASLRAADLVVVMEANQARALRHRFGRLRGTELVLGDLDPLPINGRRIIDPWGRDESVFEESYQRIERCINELVRLLPSPHRPVGPR